MSRHHYLAALALFLCAQPAAAVNPKKVAIGPGSPKGALLFRAPPFWIDQLLLFTRDGPDASSSREYYVANKNRPTAKGESVLVTTLPPGRYRLEALYQQDKWVACLQANTLKVTIEPGKIAYLGIIDTRPTLASIQRNARASNDLRHPFRSHGGRTGLEHAAECRRGIAIGEDDRVLAPRVIRELRALAERLAFGE